MKITRAGIAKRIEFPNEAAKKRYLDNLRIDGKSFYIIRDGWSEGKGFIEIVEPWRNVPLMKNINIE